MEYLWSLAEYSLRIVLAAVCGGVIGSERTNRRKEAGIRTHIIVSIASALMMIVSKYGFNDLAFGADFRLDPSRVASQIVSGVGFLGAGVIYIQNRSVTGLTTAAGIWATSGIGMAIGSGMYVMGMFSTLVIVLVQIIFHKIGSRAHNFIDEVLYFTIADTEDAIQYLKDYIESRDIHILKIKTDKERDGVVDVEITASVSKDLNLIQFIDYDRTKIFSVEV